MSQMCRRNFSIILNIEIFENYKKTHESDVQCKIIKRILLWWRDVNFNLRKKESIFIMI